VTTKKAKAKKTVADVVEEMLAADAFANFPGSEHLEIAEKASETQDKEVTFEDVKDIVLPALVPAYEECIDVLWTLTPDVGPDYHVTDAGDILLTASGAPIPEDHPVHPAHRALAAARKGKQ
jgi:hypothetical protein